MSPNDLYQIILAVAVVPTAFLIGLIVTYFVANLEQLKYKWKSRRKE